MATDLILFNFNDIALWLVVFNCLVFSCILLAVRRGKKSSNTLLALFVLVFALSALDTLMYWSGPFKAAFFSDAVTLFFIFKFGLLLQGPLLYLYTKSVIYNDFRLSPKSLWHFAPVMAFPLYLLAILFSLGHEALLAGVNNYDVYYHNPLYRGLLIAQNLSILSYGILSYRLLVRYKTEILHSHSNLDKVSRSWLQILIGGFLFLFFWELFSQISHQLALGNLPNTMGVMGNYFKFIFANVLVIFSLIHSNIVQGINSTPNEPESPDNEATQQAAEPTPKRPPAEEPLPHHIEAVTRAIEQDEIYLDPEITLDQLAKKIACTPRQVSRVINHHYQQNFFEFINSYRVERAKKLLLTQATLPMLDVMDQAGFSSKSAFNRFFKKYTQLTPTQFRQQNSLQTPPHKEAQ